MNTALPPVLYNTFKDFLVDAWIACDPAWHKHYGQVRGGFRKYHWDANICRDNKYIHIPGIWADGLSDNPECIHYGHSSSYQALGIAVLLGCGPIYLAGFDMKYEGKRHYFSELSDKPGEYPEHLRKQSAFDGLIKQFETIVHGDIFNVTEGSALNHFPFVGLEDL